jgi:hypothetical protein
MRSTYAALAAGLMLLGGCGHRDAAEPTAAGARHTLRVEARLAPGPAGVTFFAGALPEIRLVRDGRSASPVHDHRFTTVFRGLRPGRYLMVAVLRPCDGNCGLLDGPIGRCARTITVPDVGSATVTWLVGSPCRIAPVSSSRGVADTMAR